MHEFACGRDVLELLVGERLEEIDGNRDESDERQAHGDRAEHDPFGRRAGSPEWQQGQEADSRADGSQCR